MRVGVGLGLGTGQPRIVYNSQPFYISHTWEGKKKKKKKKKKPKINEIK